MPSTLKDTIIEAVGPDRPSPRSNPFQIDRLCCGTLLLARAASISTPFVCLGLQWDVAIPATARGVNFVKNR
mgnify:CR=1 FL=1